MDRADFLGFGQMGLFDAQLVIQSVKDDAVCGKSSLRLGSVKIGVRSESILATSLIRLSPIYKHSSTEKVSCLQISRSTAGFGFRSEGGTQPAFLSTHCAASTVSLNPIALVTATSVDRRGLPWTDNARYRLSRSMPAALATLAMPWAWARWRNAMSRTRGSSSSSSAAFRYSAAKSGSFRSRRMMASSCEMLALRFMRFRSFPCNL